MNEWRFGSSPSILSSSGGGSLSNFDSVSSPGPYINFTRSPRHLYGVSLERTVKRHILNWMKKTSSRSHDKDQEQLTCLKTINYRTIFHTTCLPHSHDCPLIVNKNLNPTKEFPVP